MNFLRVMLLSAVAALSLTAFGADYPYCTNGSNTGNGYGWDPAVTDPNGSHSCRVQEGQPPASGPAVMPGGNNYCDTPTFTCGNGSTVSCWSRAGDIYHRATCNWDEFNYSVRCFVADANGVITSQFSDFCWTR